jgi:hypothetical protein
MTRKDYILIAEALRVQFHNAKLVENALLCGGTGKIQREAIESVANELADSLAHDNSRFNREHFLAVVRGEKELMSRPSRNGARS